MVTTSSSGHGQPVSPTPRRVTTPRWFDLRLVLGVVLVLGSVLIGARVVSAADATYSVAAANRDLSAGVVLTADDVRSVKVQLPGHGKGTYVQTARAAVGKTLARDVSAGELLAEDAVTRTRPGTTLTVPLAAGSAPALRAGQRITVWISSATCPSVVLLPAVTVQSIGRDSGGSFSGGASGQDAVITVDSTLAARVITALSSKDATLRAGVVTGPRPATERSALPDIAPCLGDGTGK